MSLGARCRRELGASMSAIQSRRHCSCASRAHGQGDRHSDDSGPSSVSSSKHIQHFLRSFSFFAGEADIGGAVFSSDFTVSFALLGLDEGLRSIVCESSETVECASLSSRLKVCDDEAASGLDDRCVGDVRRCFGGCEAIMTTARLGFALRDQIEGQMETHDLRYSWRLFPESQVDGVRGLDDAC